VTQTPNKLEEILAQPTEVRLNALADFGKAIIEANNGIVDPDTKNLKEALVAVITSGIGQCSERVVLGEILGFLGDPRLTKPNNGHYWVGISETEFSISVGRFPVSHNEYQEFVDSGEYYNNEWWTPDGVAWRDSGVRTWGYLAKKVNSALVVANQPVVGTTWFEAAAYAKFAGGRLPTVQERLFIVRGEEKRVYPWGEPFGSNNANTSEEVVQRPCAIGLFRSDCTPNGVWDLAGNAGEWLADDVSGQHPLHPGSWKQTSMASWAKASQLEAPNYRADDLGFRLVKD
jgi:hypothetical protein